MQLETLLPLRKVDPGLRAPETPLDLRSIAADANLGEPHIWLGYSLWRQWKNGEAFQEEQRAMELDPANAAEYRNRAASYTQELRDLNEWAQAEMADVPSAKRRALTITRLSRDPAALLYASTARPRFSPTLLKCSPMSERRLKSSLPSALISAAFCASFSCRHP